MIQMAWTGIERENKEDIEMIDKTREFNKNIETIDK